MVSIASFTSPTFVPLSQANLFAPGQKAFQSLFCSRFTICFPSADNVSHAALPSNTSPTQSQRVFALAYAPLSMLVLLYMFSTLRTKLEKASYHIHVVAFAKLAKNHPALCTVHFIWFATKQITDKRYLFFLLFQQGKGITHCVC